MQELDGDKNGSVVVLLDLVHAAHPTTISTVDQSSANDKLVIYADTQRLDPSKVLVRGA